MTSVANFNRDDETLGKHARRAMIVDHARAIDLKPKEVITLSGANAFDIKLFRKYAPNARYLSLERQSTVYDQRSQIFNGARCRMVITTLQKFQKGVVAPRHRATALSPQRPISQSDFEELSARKFDLGYLDFIDVAKPEYIETMRQFLKSKMKDRFVVAVAHYIDPNDSSDPFSAYEDVSKEIGTTYHREDYNDGSPMAFALLVRE